MIFAEEKKKSNIAEYILYMWQIEDILRAYNFDFNQINDHIISRLNVDENKLEEVQIWYKDLIEKMHRENITKTGHLKFIRVLLEELNDLHDTLMCSPTEKKYQELYQWASPNIQELRKKSYSQNISDIELCLIGLYGMLMLKLQKKNISEETKRGMQTFSNLLALLSSKYKELNS